MWETQRATAGLASMRRVARAVEMAGGVGCGGRTRDVYFGCVPTEAAKLDESIQGSRSPTCGMRGRVGDEGVAGSPLMLVLVRVCGAAAPSTWGDL